MPVKISAMPQYAGDLTGVYMPIIVPVEEDNPWVNYRMLVSDFETGQRFGVLTEDDTATEDRAFTMPDTFSFAIYNGDSTFTGPVRYVFLTSAATSIGASLDLDNRADVNVESDNAEMVVQAAGVTVSQVKVESGGITIDNTSGFVDIPNLVEDATPNIVYYDTVAGRITYGPVADIGGGAAVRFAVAGEDDIATEVRTFDFDTTYRMIWSGSIVDDPLFLIQNTNIAGVSTLKVDSIGSTRAMTISSVDGRGLEIVTSGTAVGMYVQNSGTGQAATFTSIGNSGYTVDIAALVGTQSGGLSVICEGVSASALNVNCSSGIAAILAVTHDSDDTTILPILKLRRQVISVSPAVGMGASLVFELNVDDGAIDNTLVISNQITSEWTDPNDTIQTSKLTILGVSVGVDTQLMIMEGDGRISTPNLPTYADDAAAGGGGLTTGYWYQTAAGALRIKL